MPRRLALPLLSLALSCRGGQPETQPFDWTLETGDTGTDGPVVAQPKTWTDGPALPDCTPAAGDPQRVALSGVVLLPTGPVAGSVVVDRAAGTVVCAGASCDPAGATVVCTEGVISPALIDTHDHTQYNVLGPWKHAKSYIDRYDWQSDFDYYDFRTAYDDISDAYECEIVKWAELRQIVGGATSVVGSAGDACIDVLARNLDEGPEAHGLTDYGLRYSSAQVGYYDDLDAADRAADLADGTTEVFLDHVAEGIDGSVRDEIDHMFDIGMSGPGSLFVHATDASLPQLARMAVTGTGIVWSPRSNLDLYGDTTKVDVGARLGVPLAIGPDWTWSGSNRVTEELSCAYDWLHARGSELVDQDLYDMVTVDASALMGLQNRLGMLVAGAKADITVFTWTEQPYRAVIEAGYDDVRLVMIDGQARYGVPALVDGLAADPTLCEAVTACAEPRTLCVAEATTGTDAQTYSELEATLSAALSQTTMPAGLEYAGELYPLWACAEVRDTCVPGSPSPIDQDGDGIPDATDACPLGYDPLQVDGEGDGIPDVCDPCPLSPGDDCAHDPNDIDDDGLANTADGCPYLWDPGNPDADGDGKPDACDPCPSSPNPGDLGCPATVRALRDPSDPAHPAEGSVVTLTGLVVTGVGPSGAFLQDPNEADFGGLYAFGVGGAPGDQVDVTGEYVEYYGLTELQSSSATVTGTLPVPPAIDVAACDVGTGGADAERYESMLVKVSGVTVTDANPDDPSDYNEFEVAGCLRVDDQLCPDCWADQPAVGTAFGSLTGPLTYGFGDSKLLPRTAADLQ
ncbi:MAG: thrombospondin type 3 repeat-containing protein [Myxococcota bacterium]